MKKLITGLFAIVFSVAFCFGYIPVTKASDNQGQIVDMLAKVNEFKEIQNKLVTNPSGDRDATDIIINTNTTWSTNQSFAEDVYVNTGVTLTINPGVTVAFAEDYGLYVDGNLAASGTQAQPIVFTSANPPDNYYGIFGDPGSNMTFNYCNISYAGQEIGEDTYTAGITVAGSLTVDNCNFANSALLNIGVTSSTSVSVSNSTFANSSQVGMMIGSVPDLSLAGNTFQTSEADAMFNGTIEGDITNNDFTGNGIFGLNLAGDVSLRIGNNHIEGYFMGIISSSTSRIVIDGNIITNNSAGILLDGNSEADITQNTITNNAIDGIYLHVDEGEVPTVNINYNDITGNDIYGVEFGGVGISPQGNKVADLPVNATKNYWGSSTGPTHASNPAGTGDAVTDNVTFSPWLDSTFVTLPPINSINLVDGQTVGGIYPINVDAGWVVHGLPLDDMTKVDFYIDGVLKGTDTTAPYSYNWDTTVHASPHIVRVVATNILGTTNERTVNVEVVNELPYTGK